MTGPSEPRPDRQGGPAPSETGGDAPRRRLDRAPSERLTGADSSSGRAATPTGSPGRAIALGALGGFVGVAIFLVLAIGFSFTAGLLVVAIFIGRFVGLFGRSGAGATLSSAARVVTAVAIFLVALLVALVAIWLWSPRRGRRPRPARLPRSGPWHAAHRSRVHARTLWRGGRRDDRGRRAPPRGPARDPTCRRPVEADHAAIVAVVDDWWGGRRIHQLLPRLWLQHFKGTSWIAETDDGRLAGFLVGFVSPDEPTTGYVHMIGSEPNLRLAGLGRSSTTRSSTTSSPSASGGSRRSPGRATGSRSGSTRAIGFEIDAGRVPSACTARRPTPTMTATARIGSCSCATSDRAKPRGA